MKTPEEMAEEYVEAEFKGNGGNVSRAVCKHDFMSGYKAAIDLIHNNTTKEMSDLANAFAANYFGKEYAVSFDSFLAGYQAARQWISVKDRLPEEGQVALTICDNGKMFLLQKVSDEMFGVPIYWKYCCGFDKELGPNESYCYDVTHWQPLPEPPKEEK